MSGSGDKDAEELFEKYMRSLFLSLDEKRKKLVLRFLRDPERVAKQMFSEVRRSFKFRERKRIAGRPWMRAFLEMLEEYAKRRGWIIKEGNYEIFLWEKPILLVYKIEGKKFVPLNEEEAREFVRWLRELEKRGVRDLLKIRTYKFSKISTFGGFLLIGKDLASLILKREVLDGEEFDEEDTDKIIGFFLYELEKYLKEE